MVVAAASLNLFQYMEEQRRAVSNDLGGAVAGKNFRASVERGDDARWSSGNQCHAEDRSEDTAKELKLRFDIRANEPADIFQG